jgi:hypothetical protein
MLADTLWRSWRFERERVETVRADWQGKFRILAQRPGPLMAHNIARIWLKAL